MRHAFRQRDWPAAVHCEQRPQTCHPPTHPPTQPPTCSWPLTTRAPRLRIFTQLPSAGCSTRPLLGNSSGTAVPSSGTSRSRPSGVSWSSRSRKAEAGQEQAVWEVARAAWLCLPGSRQQCHRQGRHTRWGLTATACSPPGAAQRVAAAEAVAVLRERPLHPLYHTCRHKQASKPQC